MDDPRSNGLLEESGRIAYRLGLALAWTDGLEGPAAKSCSRGGAASWKRAQTLPAGEAAAAFYLTRCRTRNPAVVASASGLVLLEADGDLGELCARYGVELPDTVGVRSRRGSHRYFRPPAGRPPLKVQLDETGVTVSSDGYFVAAGGLHPSGIVYAYENGTTAIADLPVKAYDRIAELGEQSRVEARQAFVEGTPILEGQRSESLFGLALELTRAGTTEAALLERLLGVNRAQCRPPLDEQLVRKQLDGALTWARKHPTVEEELRAQARRLLDDHLAGAPSSTHTGKRALRTSRGDTIEMRSIVWKSKPLLQGSAFTLLVGSKGAGKGTWIAGQVAKTTRGEYGPKRNVLIVSSEDSAAIDLIPRLTAAGAHLPHVEIVTEHFTLPGGLPKLRQLAGQVGDVGMIVIDPLGNHIGSTNTNHDGDIRPAIGALNPLADELAVVLLGVRHIGKVRERGALAAVLGSTAWVEVPRAVLVIARDDEDTRIFHVQVIAGNRSGHGSGMQYRLELANVAGLTEPVTLAVEIGVSTKDVDELLLYRRAGSKSQTARTLILDILEYEGEQDSDAFDARVARETGLSARTVQNVRKELGKEGLVKAAPEKDETGAVTRWKVYRSSALRPEDTT